MVAKILVVGMLFFLVAPILVGVFVLRRVQRLPRPGAADREE